MDKNKICNMANGLVKNGEIIDINDGSPRAMACLLYFEQCAGIMLAFHDWSFARKFHKPNLYAQKYDGYEYTYIYPSDCIAPRKYVDEDGLEIDIETCQNVLSDNNSMELILSNKKIDNIIYTARMLNTKIWSDSFVEAFIYLLASKLISKVTGERDHNEKLEIYKTLIEEAKTVDLRKDGKTFDKDFLKKYKPLYSGRF